MTELSDYKRIVSGPLEEKLRDKIDKLIMDNAAKDDLIEKLKREAEFHAGEAKCHKSTVHEIYQVISSGKGEKGNWNGARPVIEYVEAMKAEIEQLKDDSPVRKLEGDAKWIATDLIEKIEAKDKEIERLRGKVRPKKKEKSPLQKAEQYKADLVWERYQCTGNNLTIPQGLDEEIMKATAKIKALKDTP